MRRQLSPIPKPVRVELLRLIDDVGIERIRKESGLSRAAIQNAATGEPVLVGTKGLIASAIQKLTAAMASAEESERDDGETNEIAEDHAENLSGLSAG